MGSARQARELAAAADRAGYRAVVTHVREEIEDWRPRETADIFDDARKALADAAVPPDAILNFGRATVPDGIRRIAEVCEVLVTTGCVPKGTKIIGPSERAARVWGDKSLIARALADLRLPFPHTIEIDENSPGEVVAALQGGALRLPCVLKALDLTGGSGMRYAATTDVAVAAACELSSAYGRLVACEFADGDEVSVDLLRLGSQTLCYPPGFKRPTDTALTHADHKIKVNGVRRRVPEFECDLLHIAQAFDLQGFFSLEAVVTGTAPMSWQILEGATRLTNNIQMQDASLGVDSLQLVLRYIAGDRWLPPEPARPMLALSVPIYQHRGEASITALADFDWVRQVKLEDLAVMPGSKDNRVRMTVKMAAEDLEAKLLVLVEATGDTELPAQIRAEVARVRSRYGL
jgi:hypothetical protein